MDETAADSEETSEVVGTTPAEETAKETTEEVVETTLREEAEDIVEGEAGGVETYAIGDDTDTNDVVGTFAVTGAATPTITITTPTPDSNDYVWDENAKTLTVAAAATTFDTLVFELTDLGDYRVDSVKLTMGATTIEATESPAGTYTIDTAAETINAAFDVTIDTKATNDVTATWTDANIKSVTRDGNVEVKNGEAFTVDADQAVAFTVTVQDAVKATHKVVLADDTDTSAIDTTNGVYTYTLAAGTTTVSFKTAAITYKVDTVNVDSNKVDITAPATVDAGETLTFSVSAKDDTKDIIKTVSYTMGSASEETLELTKDGEYEILNVNGDVTINVTTAALYTVTKGTNADLIKFDGDEADLTVEENTEVAFTVVEPEEATKKEVTEVSYTVGGGQKEVLGTTSGDYTIPADEVSGNIVIDVEIADKITEAVITFTPNADLKYYEANGTTEITAAKTVPTKEVFKFVVKPVADTKKVDTVTATEDGGAAFNVTGEAGVYSITPTKATVTVTATAKDLKTDLTATFDYLDGQATVTDVTGGTSSDKVVEGIKEDSDITFKVAPAGVYKVVSVKAGTDKVTAADVSKSGDVYTLTVTENVNIYIETELDESKCSALEFTVSANDLSKSFTAQVAEPTDNTDFIDDIDAAALYTVDSKTIYTANTKLNVVLTVADGYQLDKVMSGETDLLLGVTSADGKTYELENVALTPAKVTKLEVQTSVKANTTEKTVTFNSGLDKLTYTVKTEEGKVVAAKDTNDYKVTTKAEYFEFNIVTPNKDAYTPDVTSDDIGIDNFVISEATSEDGKTTYTYKIPANLLADPATTITLMEIVADKTVAVTYDSTEVEKVTATEGNENVQEDVNSITTYAGTTATTRFTVPYGTELNIAVYALENCEITSAVTKAAAAPAEEAGTTVPVKPNGFRFNITATDNTVTTVASKGWYTTRLSADGTVIAPVKGAYSVDYTTTSYVAEVFYGVNTPVAPSTAKAEVIGTTTEEGKQPTTVTVAGNKATINVSRDDAGKALEVKLYKDVPATEEAEATTAELATFKLNVTPEFKKVTVAGVKGGVIKQTLDTEHRYAIKLDPATANINDLAVAVDNQTVVTAAIDKATKELVVTTLPAKAADAKADAAIIKIYDATVKGNENPADAVALAGGEIKVTTLASAMHGDKAKPVVKTVSATDRAVTLSFEAPKGTELPVAGKLYYRVKLTAAAPANETVKAPEKLVTTAITKDIEVTKDTGLTVEDIFTVFDSTVQEGNGAKWDFDVEVAMVQTTNEQAITDANTAFTSATVAAKTATKDPYFETKLSLKKGTTTVYTGQEDVTVATAAFNKLTSYATVMEAEDVTYVNGNSNNNNLFVTTEGNQVKVKATADTNVTKHTIKVTATSPESMYKAVAYATVTVVRGIEKIDLVSPSETLYKADNKAGSLKIAAELNKGSENPAAPKAKKVTWEIYEGTTTDSAHLIDKNHELSKMITIKNGTVSVNKSYKIKSLDGDEYTVIARAADFAGNDQKVFDECTVIITDQMVELGNIAVLAHEYNNDEFTVVTRGNEKFEASALDNTAVAVFRKGAPVKDVYTGDDIAKWLVNPEQLTFKSSNKGLSVNSDGQLTCSLTKPANNISITATTNDGGKQSIKLEKLSIVYAAVAELGLMVGRVPDSRDINYVDWFTPYDVSTMSYQGTKDTNFMVCVAMSTEDGPDSIPQLTNYKLSVKGGKILSSNAVSGEYSVQPTAKDTVITLKDSFNGVEKKYTLTNTAFSNAAAPKVKTTNKLYAGYYKEAQTITYQLSGNYDWTNQYVLVNTDSAARLDKKADDGRNSKYTSFEAQGNVNNIIPINPDGTFSLNFEMKGYQGDKLGFTDIPANSYKLSFSFGTVDKQTSEFVAGVKAVSVTLKAAAQVKPSYKLVTKYTLSPAEGYKAELKGTAKGDAVARFYAKGDATQPGATLGLLNANIKGQENKFRDYFDIVDGKLVLDPTLTAEQIAAISKDDLMGYVNYGVEFYGLPPQTRTEKITVTIEKASKGYAVTSATAYQKADKSVEATVAVTKAKAAVPVTYVWADSTVFTAVPTKAMVEGMEVYTNELLMTATAAEKGSYRTDLYVVPEDSYYNDIISKTEQAKRDEAIKAYGVKVTTTIKVEEPSATAKVITLAKKEDAKTFTAKDYEAGTYTVSSAFTQKAQDAVAKDGFTVEPVDEKQPDIIKVTSVDQWIGGGRINASVSKADIAKYLEHADTPVKYGDTITSTVTLTFVSGNKQDVTIKYTLPKEPQSFDDAAKAVVEAEYDTVIPNCVEDSEAEAAEKIQIYVQSVIDALAAAGKIQKDSDMLVDVAVDTANVTLPQNEVDGTAKALITLTNAADKSTVTKELNFTLLAKGAAPADYQAALTSFVTTGMAFETNAQATRTAVITAALENLNLPDNLRLRLNSYNKEEATDQTQGYILGSFVINDIKYGNASVEVDLGNNFTIKKLDDLADTIAKIEAAVMTAPDNSFTNATTKDEVKAAIDAAIVNKGITAAWKQVPDKAPEAAEGAMKDAFEFTKPASLTENGQIDCTIVLTNATTASDEEEDKTTEAALVIEVAQHQSADTVKANVKTALSAKVLADIALANTTADAQKTAVLAAAQKAVATDPYTVAIADTPEFLMQAPTYKEDGKATFAVNIMTLGEQPTPASTVQITDITLSADEALITADEAAALVAEVLKADGDFAKTVTNTTTVQNVVDKANEAVNAYSAVISVAPKMTGEGTDAKADFTLKQATFAADGSITGTLVISKTVAPAAPATEPTVTTADVAYAYTIKKLDEIDKAVKAVQDAVAAMEWTTDVATIPAEAVTAKEAEILKLANDVIADGFTATVKDATKLTVTNNPTAVVNATATITLVITSVADNKVTQEAACTATVVLTQTLKQAKAAAQTAADAVTLLSGTDVDTAKTAVEAEVRKVIKADYEFAWADTELTAEGVFTGTLYILEVGESFTRAEAVYVNLTVQTAP